MRATETSAPSKPRNRRAKLSRELILDTALEVARRPGVDSVRIRDLGKALKADSSAVYRHFQSKDDLMSALIDRVNDELLRKIDTSADRNWRELLVDLSEKSLELHLEYPAVGASVASVSTDSTDIVEVVLHALQRAGLRGDALVRHYTLFASYLLSFSGAIVRSRIETDDAAERPYAEDVRAATAQTHPVTSEFRERILTMRYVDVYRSSVQLILDSAEAAAESPPA